MAKLQTNTTLSITKNWFQKPNGFTYPIAVRVPTLASLNGKRIPVAILLHGNGGNGEAELNNWNSILPDHILIAPTGYLNSWNVAHEPNKAPDLSFLQDVCNKLKTYENVDGSKIRLIGFSNGAGLANRAYVALDDSSVDQIVTIATSFIAPMYKNDNFYIPINESSTGPNASDFPIIKIPYKPRKFISFHGSTDANFPYIGGAHSFGFTFLSAQASAYAVAKAQGYAGVQILDNIGAADVGGTFKYTYDTPYGDVLHYKYPEGHEVTAAIKTIVNTNFTFVHANQPNAPTDIAKTKWNYNTINVVDAGGTYPSATTFTSDGQVITATSNGDPYPALAGTSMTNTGERSFDNNPNFIKPLVYNFRIKDRAGDNTANPDKTELGGMGIFANGVLAANPSAGDHSLPGSDIYPPIGFNYNAVHLQSAYGVDDAGGHPEANGSYHYHDGSFLNSSWTTNKLYAANAYYNQTDFNGDKFRHISGHSKILGYCFDGYPIYGPYGYTTGTDINSTVVKMTSSYYVLPNDNHRPGDFKYDRVINVNNVGDVTLTAGSFLQDFEYRTSLGTLDRYNGRFTKTPDFPDGTYAYFLAFGNALESANTIIHKVTVASGINSYGSGNKYYITGKTSTSPTLTLREGNTYRFDQSHSSNATHQIRFSLTGNGPWTGNPPGVEYTTGVKINGTAGQAGGYSEITIPNGSPDVHYYCINHSGMGGQLSTYQPTAYPYIFGTETKQSRTLVPSAPDQETLQAALLQSALWNIATGTKISNLIERSVVDIKMPMANGVTPKLKVISGSLPNGTRIEGTSVAGTVYEVAYNKTFAATIRATYKGLWEDRTIEFDVTGPDDPVWGTPKGDLPIGENSVFYVLDSAQISFQLAATDTDIAAGDSLSFFIADGDGLLPPGITMSETGLLTGITDPLLSLDKRYEYGGYDSEEYGTLPLDYGILPSNGFSSFFYDSETYDYNEPTANPRKLNRYYPFAVTVTDGESFVKREFQIYVVGDDFLKADNTLMSASTGIFKSSATNVRKPTWITPGNLGFRRANNYQTVYLDIINNTTLEGKMLYTPEDLNDDGTPSVMPPGLVLDKELGELVGNIPYQAAITQDYKFTIRATRMTTDLESVSIVATYYEDTILGKTSFKIGKLNLTGSLDGVNDLFELIGRDILLGKRSYKVTSVDDRNTAYDIIFVDQTIAPSLNLVPSRTAIIGQSYTFINRLSEIQKEKYNNRFLRFTETEKYKIAGITPYIEYEVEQLSPSTDEIYPAGVPRLITVGTNYFVGDIIANTTATGGDGKIYKCVTAHTVLGTSSVHTFTNANWTEIAEQVSGMTLADRVAATKQVLVDAYNGPAYVQVLNDQATRWRIHVPSTATSRIVSNIKAHFVTDDSTQLLVKLLRDNEDRIQYDINLARQLTEGNNYGIGLFRGDSFSENIIVANTKDIPSTTKTFTMKVIGEIDSTIKWITPAALGSIPANYISNLRIEAQTTVPDTRMIYSVKLGKLPYGMRLATDGEIIGNAQQFNTPGMLGLTTFEKKAVKWDGILPGDTTFDRKYTFTIEAKDRFAYTAIEREFTLTVSDLDTKKYTDIYMRPLLPSNERISYANFISDRTVFDPEKIYRANDPEYGIRRNLDMLVYAGIEGKKIENFVAASAKNHKRKKYILGDFKTAKATSGIGSTAKDLYEVVYIEVIDPANAKKGKTKSSFNITTTDEITVDSIAYSPKDDDQRFRSGYDALPIYTRGVTKFIFEELEDTLIIQTRDSSDSSENQFVNADKNDFTVTLKGGSDVTVTLQLTDAEPQRLRPKTNTITTDSDAVKVSQGLDNKRYISSVVNMRNNIKQIGANERSYLPLWMRTPQAGFQELDYVTAIPVCYCKPGQSADILRNIKTSGFDTKTLTFDIDRYIVKSTEDITDERYILFANYEFNV